MGIGFLDKNLEAMMSVYPHLVKEVKDYRKTSTEERAYRAGISMVEGRKILYVLNGEVPYHLDSLYTSMDILELWIKGFPKLMLKSKICMFGFGNGMYVRKILEATPEDVTIIVYEPSIEIMNCVLEEFDLTDLLLSERVTLLLKTSANIRPEEYFYELLDFRDIDGLVIKTYLNYTELFEEDFDAFHHGVQKVVNSIVSTQDVIGRYGEMYYQNTFSNLKYFLNSKSLEGLYHLLPEGYPAIIVAAGPSLDKNVLELKKAKDKAFIIAVDTAMRPLLRNGIEPDICISIDGKKRPAHFSEEGTEKIPLICYLLSHSAILEKHKAEKFFINDLNHHIQDKLSQMEKVLPVVASGGSVANDAFSIAQALGFRTMILVGQDLAYTDDKTHASATVRGEEKIDAKKLKRIMVEGVHGDQVASSPEFELYRAWFEEQVIKFPHLKIYDATEGGAKIHGTIITTLKDVIEKECTKSFCFSDLIHITPDFFNEEEKAQMWEYLFDLPVELEKCKRQIQTGIRYYDKMLELVYTDKYHSQELKRNFEKVSQIGDELDQDPALDYVRNRIQKITTELIRHIYQIEEDEKTELKTACTMGRNYLKVMEDEIDRMLPDVEAKLGQYENKKL